MSPRAFATPRLAAAMTFGLIAASSCKNILGIDQLPERDCEVNAGCGGAKNQGGVEARGGAVDGGAAGKPTTGGTTALAGDTSLGGKSASGGQDDRLRGGDAGAPLLAGAAGDGGEAGSSGSGFGGTLGWTTGGTATGDTATGGTATGGTATGGTATGGTAGDGNGGEAGTSGEAGAGGIGAFECSPAQVRCTPNDELNPRPSTPQSCVNGHWQNSQSCKDWAYCIDGDCVSPPSCPASLPRTCGAGHSESCCEALEVPGGTFKRSYDGETFLDDSYPATIRSLMMDKFEVTVGRFRNFIAAYPQLQHTDKLGKSSYIAGDPGWNAAWPWLELDELKTALACDADATWSDSAASADAENLPINCVDYYVAAVFCIWDKGRLPTEAEWNYAASGGAQQRVYPWSVPSDDGDISTSNANYDAMFGETPALTIVGSKRLGDGRWGHSDLAGNVAEWTLDYYATPYEKQNCTNCLTSQPVPFAVRVLRGGHYWSDEATLFSSSRSNDAPEQGAYYSGFRCVHELSSMGEN
jgi:sulfatase modifying factor 1